MTTALDAGFLEDTRAQGLKALIGNSTKFSKEAVEQALDKLIANVKRHYLEESQSPKRSDFRKNLQKLEVTARQLRTLLADEQVGRAMDLVYAGRCHDGEDPKKARLAWQVFDAYRAAPNILTALEMGAAGAVEQFDLAGRKPGRAWKNVDLAPNIDLAKSGISLFKVVHGFDDDPTENNRKFCDFLSCVWICATNETDDQSWEYAIQCARLKSFIPNTEVAHITAQLEASDVIDVLHSFEAEISRRKNPDPSP